MNANVNPKTIFTGDNLPIMRGMNSESVDLIYLDPPFNSNANYAAPIGSEAAGAEFKDTWTLNDVDAAWLDLIEVKHPQLNRVIHAAMTNSDKSYLIYMAVRLIEMHRILKPTGSIYLHCDPTMSHYLKLVMDSIFGEKQFRNEIIWQRTNAHNLKAKYFSKTHDVLLFYSKDQDYTWNTQYTDYSQAQLSRYKKDETGRLYTGRDLTVSSGGNRNFQWRGSRPSSNRSWGASLEQLERWYTEGRILLKKDGTPRLDGLKVYLDELPGKQIPAIWTDIPRIGNTSKERLGYPTQKPLALLERIIKASSNEGDIVFDPFCGCATTLVAADRDQRNWIGIDISAKAAELVVERIRDDQGLFEDIVARSDIPKRTDLGDIPRYNSTKNKTWLYGEQGGNCNGCGSHFEKQHLEIDHIIAESVGGTDHLENLQLLCSHCNRIKGDRGQEYLVSKLLVYSKLYQYHHHLKRTLHEDINPEGRSGAFSKGIL